MGQPQGSSFDAAYIDSLTKQVEGISVCSELQEFMSDVVADLNRQLDALKAQMEALAPIAKLLENPAAELPKIASWIGDFIEGVLKPMYQPHVTMASQIEQTIAAVSKLEAAVVAKAEEIGSCAVTMPSLNQTTSSVQSGSGTTSTPE